LYPRFSFPLRLAHPTLPRALIETGTAISNDPEDQIMNKDILEGKWKQIRGEAKAWWGDLTDDDLDRVAGKFDVLAGLLQEKYGYTRERAADEIEKRVTAFEDNLKEKTHPNPVS
jgi:uncharacterized protein YjbJ (UPF0337 family)